MTQKKCTEKKKKGGGRGTLVLVLLMVMGVPRAEFLHIFRKLRLWVQQPTRKSRWWLVRPVQKSLIGGRFCAMYEWILRQKTKIRSAMRGIYDNVYADFGGVFMGWQDKIENPEYDTWNIWYE